MDRLLVVDTETGGTDAAVHNILSLGCVVWEDGVLGPQFEVLIAEPTVSVTTDALAVNGIDIQTHWKEAADPAAAMAAFQIFLRENFAEELRTKHRIALVGHNVGFDVAFIKRFSRLTGVAFDDLFSHRTLDTAAIVRFLVLAKVLTLSSAGSNEVFEHFGIVVPKGKRHTALGDAVATGQLLTKLVDHLKATTVASE